MALRSWISRAAVLSGAPGLRALDVSREEWQRIRRILPPPAGDCSPFGAAALSTGLGDLRGVPRGSGRTIGHAGAPGPDTPFPGLEGDFPAAAGCNAQSRTSRDCTAPIRIRAPGCVIPRGPRITCPCGIYPTRPNSGAGDRQLQVRAGRGRGSARDSVGPIHAGPSNRVTSDSRGGRKSPEARRAARLCAQGHRTAFHATADPRGTSLGGTRLGRFSVAFSWAYCQALEAWPALTSPRAAWLRALGLELERVANHLGDLGASAMTPGSPRTRAILATERILLRATHEAFGSRYLLDLVVPVAPAGICPPMALEGLRTACSCCCRKCRACVRSTMSTRACATALPGPAQSRRNLPCA